MASGAAPAVTPGHSDHTRRSGRVPDVLRRLGVGPERAVACRNLAGDPVRLVVCPAGDEVVVVSVSTGGPLRLTGRQARRLAAVLVAAHTQNEPRRT